MNKVQRRRCTYCNAESKLTQDHVPPQCLFLKPRPSDLVTVPACEWCNASFAMEDEYFRMFLVALAYRNPVARKLWDSKLIGSKNAAAIQRVLRQSMTTAELRTPAGLFLGNRVIATLDAQRVMRVVARTVWGLLWHHYRVRPHQSIRIQGGMLHDFSEFEVQLAACSRSSMGDGSVFRYWHGVPSEDRSQSLWFLEFYSTVRFMVFATRSEIKADWLLEVPHLFLQRKPPLRTS